jgi:hypothetical protein
VRSALGSAALVALVTAGHYVGLPPIPLGLFLMMAFLVGIATARDDS